MYRGGRYTCESLRIFVIFGNCPIGQLKVTRAVKAWVVSGIEHSGPTPRGRGASAATMTRANVPEKSRKHGFLIMRIVMTGLRKRAVKESFTKGVWLGIKRLIWV